MSAEFPLPLATPPMEAKSVAELPEGPEWQYEPKWDGFRCLAFRADKNVELRAKSGKPLGRFFPDIVDALSSLSVKRFVIDGELVIPVRGRLSFDALQMRLHPAASRVNKLAVESPAMLVSFDCLSDRKGKDVTSRALSKRREALEELFSALADPGVLRLSPYTRARREALQWLRDGGESMDGVVAKRWDEPYQPGERAMLKVKRLRTADCVVGGFRYESGGKEVGSLLLGLYDDEGKLDHVGFTSTLPRAERKALTRRLERLIEPPGFTGDAPGGPSRWSTERSSEWEPLRPELVVEVQFDHVSGDRFRHGTKLVRWRPDKAPRQCTFEQLEQPARPGSLMKKVLRGRIETSPGTSRRA